MFPQFTPPPHHPMVFTPKDRDFLKSLRICPDPDCAGNPHAADGQYPIEAYSDWRPIRQAHAAMVEKLIADHPTDAAVAQFNWAPTTQQLVAMGRAREATKKGERCRCGAGTPEPACYL